MYCSPYMYVISVMHSRRTGWARHVARMEKWQKTARRELFQGGKCWHDHRQDESSKMGLQ